MKKTWIAGLFVFALSACTDNSRNDYQENGSSPQGMNQETIIDSSNMDRQGSPGMNNPSMHPDSISTSSEEAGTRKPVSPTMNNPSMHPTDSIVTKKVK